MKKSLAAKRRMGDIPASNNNNAPSPKRATVGNPPREKAIGGKKAEAQKGEFAAEMDEFVCSFKKKAPKKKVSSEAVKAASVKTAMRAKENPATAPVKRRTKAAPKRARAKTEDEDRQRTEKALKNLIQMSPKEKRWAAEDARWAAEDARWAADDARWNAPTEAENSEEDRPGTPKRVRKQPRKYSP